MENGAKKRRKINFNEYGKENFQIIHISIQSLKNIDNQISKITKTIHHKSHYDSHRRWLFYF